MQFVAELGAELVLDSKKGSTQVKERALAKLVGNKKNKNMLGMMLHLFARLGP